MLGRGVLSRLHTLTQQETFTLTLYLDTDQNKQANRKRGYVVQAEALLKEAGFEKGFEVTLTGPNDRYVNDEKICEAVAKYLAKIGLKVTLDVKPKSIFFDELSDFKHRFYLIGWFDGSYDFGRSAEKLLHTPDKEKGMGAYNGAIYSDPELDKMIMTYRNYLDAEERIK